MTSPALNTPLRSEAEAQFAVAHARHRNDLTEISYFLQSHGASERLMRTLAEVHERLCNEMAERIKNG